MALLPQYSLKRGIRRFYNSLPFKFLGLFRLMPVFFVAGATLEFLMINWHVGEVNFYKTYKKRRIEEAVEQRLQEMNG